MPNLWITVRMDDGGIVAATVHASETYPHPHADYDDNPNPTTHVAVDLVVPPAVQEALQAAIDGARARLTGDATIAAMRATLRAADRPTPGLQEDGNHEIEVGGTTAPTGTDPNGGTA